MVSGCGSGVIAWIEGRDMTRGSAKSLTEYPLICCNKCCDWYYFLVSCLPCNYLINCCLTVLWLLLENINYLLVLRESMPIELLVFYLFVRLFLSYNLIASAHCVSFLCFISFLYSLIVYSLIYCVDVLLF